MSALAQIRPARESDIPEILALDRSITEAPHWSEAAYGSYLAAAPTRAASKMLLVAVQANRLFGYAAASAVMDEAELETIAVAMHARHEGLGSRLLAAIEAWAREQGTRALLLEVRSANEAAQAFYAARGFTPAGLRPGYYASPVDDAVLLRKELVPDDL